MHCDKNVFFFIIYSLCNSVTYVKITPDHLKRAGIVLFVYREIVLIVYRVTVKSTI